MDEEAEDLNDKEGQGMKLKKKSNKIKDFDVMYRRRDEVDWEGLERHRRRFAEKTDLYVRATFGSLALK